MPVSNKNTIANRTATQKEDSLDTVKFERMDWTKFVSNSSPVFRNSFFWKINWFLISYAEKNGARIITIPGYRICDVHALV